ncbi:MULTISPECIES: SDR family oxidoreductase [Saccharothrix]|uniref:SDR family oxidoreductase n=1 Tax=Saccharothrix TaxID=2071 RepID=UPI001301938D|nr:SDR family oxidoreductase [Saccharothrix sp. CB00851]
MTGASRGIGRAIALRLAADGMRVVVHCARDADAAAAVASEAGRGSFAVRASLPSELDALVAALPPLDVLVNNAAIGLPAAIEDVTPEAFDEVFAVNVRAPWGRAARGPAVLSRAAWGPAARCRRPQALGRAQLGRAGSRCAGSGRAGLGCAGSSRARSGRVGRAA